MEVSEIMRKNNRNVITRMLHVFITLNACQVM